MSQRETENVSQPAQPEVRPVPSHRRTWQPGQTMLLPTVEQIDAFVRAIPYGQRIDVTSMRKTLAAQYHASFTCPVTTGKHLRGVVEEAFAAMADGSPPEQVTPVWRMVDATSSAAKRRPGDDYRPAPA